MKERDYSEEIESHKRLAQEKVKPGQTAKIDEILKELEGMEDIEKWYELIGKLSKWWLGC